MRLTTQMPSGARDALGAALAIDPKTIRVVADDVGGGFGMKTGIFPEDIVVAYAARALGRPVRWAAERGEDFLAANHGRDVISHAELALDAEGKVLGYRLRSLADVGAYASTTGIIIQVLIGPWVSTSIYDIRTIDFQFDAVLTNTTPTGAYRGAGRPEAIYLIERLFDAAARQTGIDPVEIRRRNLIAASQMPYTNAMGQVYDSGDFAAVLDAGLQVADWAGFAGREAQSRARGKLRGRGFASFLEWTGGNAFEERVTCAVSGAGEIEVYASTMPMGQGIATSYAQLVVDVFGVDIAKVRIVTGDTDRGAGFGSAGSRSLFTAGSAIDVAATKRSPRAANSPATRWRRRRPISNTSKANSASPEQIAPSACSSLRRVSRNAAFLSIPPRRSAARAGPTAAMSARSRSILKPAWSRSSPMPRPTTSVASSIR